MADKRTQRTARIALLIGLIGTHLALGGSTPQVKAADAIPDSGLPEVIIPADRLVSDRTEVLAAGVRGINKSNDSFPQQDTHVMAFAEHDGLIYVGGKFNEVEIAATGERHSQRFLAAFDRETGEWVSSFRPNIDGNVWDLKVTDDGDLIVAGQFRSVNGAPNTAGIARIDLSTGQVRSDWSVNLVLTGSSRWAMARALDIEGEFLYIAGNFTRITGTNGSTSNAGQMARVRLESGNVDGSFLPNFDGIVFDVDAIDDKVYAVGNYLYTNGSWTTGQTTLRSADGQIYPGQQPHVRTDSNVYRNYQQAVLPLGDEVWLAGSQHNKQVYRASDFGLIRSFMSMPWGDGQALVELDGVVYEGSHANGYLYADAYHWDTVYSEYSSRQANKWIAAFDATIGGSHDHLGEWYPQVGSEFGEGAWELFADSVDCLWAGGDFFRGSYDGDTPRYASGFVRFCSADDVAPGVPTDLLATPTNNGIELSWTGTEDDRKGQVRYELIRNDAVFATYVGTTTFRDVDGSPGDRYFVRAIDETGNRSATTPVAVALPDTQAPTVPQNVVATDLGSGTVTVSWDASTDDRGVRGYIVYEDGAEIARTASTEATVGFRDAGSHSYQVLARDTSDNRSERSAAATIEITGDPGANAAPSTPRDVTAAFSNGSVDVSWAPSTDDGTVVEYVIFADGDEVGRTTATSYTVTSPPDLARLYQVAAIDDLGVSSARSTGVDISPGGFNVAYGQPATTSSFVPGVFDKWGPEKAVDGETVQIKDDMYSSGYESSPWWQVDLGAQVALDRVKIWNQGGSDSWRLNNFYVFVSDSDMSGRSLSSLRSDPAVFETHFGGTVGETAEIDTETTGRYVRIQLGYFMYLQMQEVEVFSAGSTLAESEAPTTPTDVSGVVDANGDVTLSWTASTDNVGVAEYIVFRNGEQVARVTGTSSTIPSPGDGPKWYQVQAVDAAGNASALTPALRIVHLDGPDTTNPTTPQDLEAVVEDNGDVTLTWMASTDNVGVAEYIVFRNGIEIDRATTTTAVIEAPESGTHFYQVSAVDAAGNEGFKTPSVEVLIDATPGDDTAAPTGPRDLSGVIEDNGDVTLTWTASTDNVAVTDYIVFRNGTEIDRVTEPTATIPTPAVGSHWYQVLAADAAGNESWKTPSLRIDIAPAPGDDTTAPTGPRDLAGVIEDNGDVTLTWTASTDNVAVTDYIVFRNGTEIDRVTEPTATIPTPAVGSHWYQVLAADAAGNTSWKTPSLRIDIAPAPGDDTTAPTGPRDLAGVIEDNGDVTLTWTASTDNVAVTDYIVFRNGTEIDRVTEPTATIPTPAVGSHWYQVLAADAAGNTSWKTAPVRIDISLTPDVDVTPPTGPRDLAGVVEANGDVTLTWTASTDNVAVTDYIVFRNGIEIDRVTEPTATIPTPAVGSHWYQVLAADAAGNTSWKTAPVRIDI